MKLTLYHLNPKLWKHHLLLGIQQPLTVTMQVTQKCAVSCLSYNRFIPMLPGKNKLHIHFHRFSSTVICQNGSNTI
jgi:hypothetical protein